MCQKVITLVAEAMELLVDTGIKTLIQRSRSQRLFICQDGAVGMMEAENSKRYVEVRINILIYLGKYVTPSESIKQYAMKQDTNILFSQVRIN